MMYKYSYCRFCSADTSDIRILKVENYTVKCEACGKMLFQVPVDSKSPYYYLEEMPLYERSRRR